MRSGDTSGTVFNIQKFSVHDGAGIRTMIFLKGCPLRCRWCSNPESQLPGPELAFNPGRCISWEACGLCLQACTQGAVTVRGGRLCLDRGHCEGCLACASVCPSGALSVYGEEMSVDKVLARVEEDGAFYSRSGGGLTLSGGEALSQPEFALSLLKEARRRHINTAMETCGFYDYKRLAEAAPYLNQLIYDLKHHDSGLHEMFTGVGNERILENFERVCADFPALPILVRTPVIPGFNSNRYDVRKIRELLPERANLSYELLPYHRMGQPKYDYTGRVYSMPEAKLDEAVFQSLKEIAAGKVA